MRQMPVADPGVPDIRSATRYLLWLLRHQRATVVLGALYGIIWMLSQALLPAAVGHTIDAGITGRSTGALLRWSGLVLGLGLVTAASGVLRHRCAMAGYFASSYRTIQVITRQAVRLGATLRVKVAAGDVVAVGTADILNIAHGFQMVPRVAGAVVAIGVVAAVMLAESVQLGLVVLIGVPAAMAVLAPVIRALHHRQRRYRALQGELAGRATDIAAGLRVLRGIGGEQAFVERYRRESQELRVAGINLAGATALLEASQVLVPGLVAALVTWLAARSAVEHRISAGGLVTFYGYAAFLTLPLSTLTDGADILTRAHVAARRVVRILRLTPDLTDPPAAAAEPAPGAALTDAASGLVTSPGRVLAVASADADAAARLAERLAWYDDTGDAALGGVPLAMLPLAHVRERILLTRHTDRFFAGRLRDELDVRGAADEAGIAAAIHTASADDIVDALPDGLDTEVADDGRTFSGGQLQRLRLARALVADPEILLLVEPTSAVDAHTEARIAERLAKSRAGRTTVIFTTSPLLLDRVDEVAYVVDGRVAARGPHRGLLHAVPGYAELVTRNEDAV